MSLDYNFSLNLKKKAPTMRLASPMKNSEEQPANVSRPYLKSLASTMASSAINPNPVVPPQYFGARQLLSLYNVPTVLPAAGKKRTTVAIVIAFTYPGLLADLATYWKSYMNFGANSKPPTVNVYTMPGAVFNDGWAQEECLDVQMVCSINPNANIWVVEAKSDENKDLMAAINYAINTIHADVISMSWGSDDLVSLTPYNTNFVDVSTCFCCSSGDNNSVSWPAVLPNCIAVGGTTLSYLDCSGNPAARQEYTWDSAGCGYSATMTQPAYQKNISGINHTYRVIPDLSLIANPNNCVYTVYGGVWSGVGGTSVSAPLFSAMLSLANQMRFNSGKSALTTVYSTSSTSKTVPANNIQNYLYTKIYTNPTKYAQDFFDVTLGNDKGSANVYSLTTFNEGVGFNVPTGLGAPNCANLCNDLLLL